LLFIQPWPDVLEGQLLRDLPDCWLVLAVVAQEDIKDLGFGVLYIHTEPLLGSIIGKLDYLNGYFSVSIEVNNYHGLELEAES